MKSFIAVSAIICMSIASYAQGINFEKGDWKTVKEKAVKENKLIYIDVFAKWCGPCKFMALKYFPTKEAGDFYNEHFVCYKIDAEEGEGITIADKYDVTAYPTNLFIDGKTGKLIFRTSGMPEDINGFIENGRAALAEQKSPMSIEAYQQKFQSGKYDEAFLKEYLEKNRRLQKDNDAVIDAYLKLCCKKAVTDSTLLLILQYQSGVENNGYKTLLANEAEIDKLKKETGYLHRYKKYWYYMSLNKAVENGDTAKVESLLTQINDFNVEDPLHIAYYYKEKVLNINGDTAKLWQVRKDFANKVMTMTDNDFDVLFEKSKPAMIEQIKWQAKQQGAKDEDMDAIIKMNLELPTIKYMTQSNYANSLNEIAWDIYEQNKNKLINVNRINDATKWAAKAMELTKASPNSWLAVADTYAHLLYIQGKKNEAIETQQKVVEKAKETNDGGIADYEDFLNELKK